ncbi:MAG: reactive intermediate/imine deaminase [Sulfobacillus benefaciens]|jgi:reactive intermediate/imine deaminase|uniref:Reactive intermediate/imine deaminase n=1 Tax=Sulfobacillus benefaciens TaxID=453960 RepID=A0A2T2WV00_9FIRM|nr:MAG: reactive intermediate/imine deaminase [Sulfobacillus benefaciens]
MSSLKAIQTAKAPAPGGAYSQGIQAGSIVFTAGLGPIDPETGGVVGETVEEQTRQVMLNLKAILEEAGLGLNRVIKTTVHLQNLEQDFAGFNEIYESFFEPPYPVRTTVGSTLKGILVEIDMVALAE